MDLSSRTFLTWYAPRTQNAAFNSTQLFEPFAGLRSKGQSFSTMSNWLFTFGVVQLSPLALKRIAWKVYIIYAVFNAAIAFLVYMLFPETTVNGRYLCIVYLFLNFSLLVLESLSGRARFVIQWQLQKV